MAKVASDAEKLELANLIFSNALGSIMGFECSTYEHKRHDIDLRDKTQCEFLSEVFRMINYDSLRKSLLHQDDKKAIEIDMRDRIAQNEFKHMQNVMSHSNECLINVCCLTSYAIHQALNRKIFSLESPGAHIKEIHSQISEYKDKIILLIYEKIDHACL